MARRVLVTGAGGFVGRSTVTRLLSDGMRVRALIRRGTTFRDSTPQCEYVRGDVTDPASIRSAMSGCDIVFHCAWGGHSLKEGRQVNVQGTRYVVEAAADAGVQRVVHLSTMAVHGRRLPPTLTETCPFDLNGDAYGVSKGEGEQAAFALGDQYGVEIVALRPTLVYGPGAPLWVLNYFQRVKCEQVALIDGGTGLANLIFVDDLVDAMCAAAERPGVAGDAFLVSHPEPVTWRDYLGAFARMCGKPAPPSVPRWRARIEVQVRRVHGLLTQSPRRLVGMDLEMMSLQTRVSVEHAAERLGWRAATPFAEGMRRCEVWLREEGYLPRIERPGHAEVLTGQMRTVAQ